MSERALEILIVEDDPFQLRLATEILQVHEVKNNLNVVNNGHNAIDYILKQGEYTKAVTPDLIILDLKLPGKDGYEVLEEIKKSDTVSKVPVIILTSSRSEEDVIKAYEYETLGFISKPLSPKKFYDAIEALKDYLQNRTIFTIISGDK